MRYVKLLNGKVVDSTTGIQPLGTVPVIVKWSRPEEYPPEFYYNKTSSPKVTVIDDETVEEHWDFLLKPVETIKEHIYKIQKSIRQKKQLGTFFFGGIPILLKDNEDSLLIQSLDPQPLRFKVAGGIERIPLTAEQVVAFKQAHREHVQLAYDWEEQENIAVGGLTTHNQLNEYLTQLEEGE